MTGPPPGEGGANGWGNGLAASAGWTLTRALMVIRGMLVKEVFNVIWAWAFPGSNGGAAEMVN